jgi:nitrogen fixation protein
LGASVLDGSIKLAFGISSDIPKVHEEGLVAVEEELWGGGVLTEVVF